MINDTYIKQCEMAEEIQKKWYDIVDGDYYYWSVDKKVHLSHSEDFMNEHGYIVHYPEQWDSLNGRKVIYLPTLEQLFEMVGDYRKQIDRPFLSLMVMKKYKYKSMQELVLNAVMEIKYNKLWNGKSWEVIK